MVYNKWLEIVVETESAVRRILKILLDNGEDTNG